MIYFKNAVGIIPEELNTEVFLEMLRVAEQVYIDFGQDAWVTSIMDGVHRPMSKHYSGEAIDLRIWFFRDEEKDLVAYELQQRLGEDYDVVLESDHIHVEYDPK